MDLKQNSTDKPVANETVSDDPVTKEMDLDAMIKNVEDFVDLGIILGVSLHSDDIIATS